VYVEDPRRFKVSRARYASRPADAGLTLAVVAVRRSVWVLVEIRLVAATQLNSPVGKQDLNHVPV
jgi:hypothetical protein